MDIFQALEPWQQEDAFLNFESPLPPPLDNYIIREVYLYRLTRNAYIPPEILHTLERFFQSLQDSVPSSRFSSLSLQRRNYESGGECSSFETTPDSRINMTLEHQLRGAVSAPNLDTDSGDTRASLFSPFSVLGRTDSVASSHTTNRIRRSISGIPFMIDNADTFISGVDTEGTEGTEDYRNGQITSISDDDSIGMSESNSLPRMNLFRNNEINLVRWLAYHFCVSRRETRETIDTLLLREESRFSISNWFHLRREGWFMRIMRWFQRESVDQAYQGISEERVFYWLRGYD